MIPQIKQRTAKDKQTQDGWRGAQQLKRQHMPYKIRTCTAAAKSLPLAHVEKEEFVTTFKEALAHKQVPVCSLTMARGAAQELVEEAILLTKTLASQFSDAISRFQTVCIPSFPPHPLPPLLSCCLRFCFFFQIYTSSKTFSASSMVLL